MTGLKKQALALTLILLILVVSFSGCISEFMLPPESTKKHPDVPSIAVHSNGYVDIVWQNGTGAKDYPLHLSYMKLDKENKILTRKSLPGYNPNAVIDSADNLHIIHAVDDKLSYTKLDVGGNIMVNTTSIPSINSGKIASVLINSQNHIYIIYRTTFRESKENSIWTIELDSNGSMLNETCLVGYNSKFFNIQAIVDNDSIFLSWIELVGNGTQQEYCLFDRSIKGNLSKLWCGEIVQNGSFVSMSIISSEKEMINSAITTQNNSLFIIWEQVEKYMQYTEQTYCTVLTKNFSSSYTKNIPKMRVLWGKAIEGEGLHLIAVDTKSYLQIIYVKLDVANNSTISTKITDKVDYFPSFQYLRALIHNDYIYIVWCSEKEYVWTGGKYPETLYYSTVYYAKLDKDGNILIKDMVIDTDGKPSWETSKYTGNILAVVLWVVGVAWIGFFLTLRTDPFDYWSTLWPIEEVLASASAIYATGNMGNYYPT